MNELRYFLNAVHTIVHLLWGINQKLSILVKEKGEDFTTEDNIVKAMTADLAAAKDRIPH